MIHELRIPHMGSVENARLVAWRVQQGEEYSEGDVLYEIETDKTTTEVEAISPGILARQLASPGDDFKVGDQIGLWADPGTSLSNLEPDEPSLSDEAGTPELPVTIKSAPALAADHTGKPLSLRAAQGRRISPLARRLAAQFGVDVSNISGSGAGGKITGADVRLAADAAQLDANHRTAQQGTPPVMPRPGYEGEYDLVTHSMRRKTIARKMSEAGAVPSLTADMEVDLTNLMAARRQPGNSGVSVLGLLAHQTIFALLQHPRLNAHWQDDCVLQWNTVHLGIAVDTDDGLVVPVIRNAERLSALGLTQEIAALAEAAREGRLQSSQLEGGTFTISNPGSVGPVIRAEALLNVPQVALLGLPGIVRSAVPVPDGVGGWAIAVRQSIRPSLTFDHRALDGGHVIKFLNTLKGGIEGL